MTQPKFGHKILLGAALVVVLVFLLFAAFNDYRQSASSRASLHDNLENLGKVLGANINSWLAGRTLLAQGMTESMARDSSSEALNTLLQQPVMAQTFVASYVGMDDGRFLISPARQMPDGFNARQRPWYKDAVASGKALLTEPYIGAGTDYLVMTQAVPFKDAQGHNGVLGVNLNLQTLAQILNAVDLNGLGYAFLVSADGKVLVHPDKSWVTKNLKDLFADGAPTLTSDFSEVQEGGQPRILTFTAIDGLPSVHWYIGLSIDPQKAFAAQHEFRLTALVASVIAVALTLALLGLLISFLLRPLHSMERAMQSIAEGEGDLTQRLQVVSQDEFGVLASAFNRFVARIQQSITEVAHTCQQLNALAVRVNQASNSSMHSSDTQAGHSQSVATAINQLGAAAQEIARSAAHASQRASGARQQTEHGRQVVVRSIAAMDQLSQRIGSSRQSIEQLNSKTASISRILDVIKGISDQTNLLALNAAIEAARAGEAGRGFAVVSDEVRSLAHRTQQSAAEIHSMIEELQSGAAAAVRTMLESQRYSDENVQLTQLAGERLSDVMTGIGEIDGINLSMATATEEQSTVIDTLDRDITTITDLNQSVVTNLQTTLQACAELENEAQRLHQMVGSFRI